MTAENKSIWHNRKHKPKSNRALLAIVVYRKNKYYAGCYYSMKDFVILNNATKSINKKYIDSWAYMSDLVSASKALDLARELYIKKCGK